MSLNICLVTSDLREDHPQWNFEKHTGDQRITQLLKLPVSSLTVDEVTVVERPADFGVWRDTLNGWPASNQNPGRFEHMLNLLEADDRYWIYLST